MDTCVSIQNNSDHEMLSDSNKCFTFVGHICSFISMTPEVFFAWQSCLFCFVLQMPLKFLQHFINIILCLTAKFVLWHQWQFLYSLFSRHILFSSFIPLTLEIIDTCVSLQNNTGHEVLTYSHKYVTFVSHICSFISMIFFVFLHLAAILLFFLFLQMPIMILLFFINILHWQPHLFSDINDFCIPVWWTYFIFLFYTYAFNFWNYAQMSIYA